MNERAEKERQEKQFEDLADNSMLLGCNDEEKYFMEYADKVCFVALNYIELLCVVKRCNMVL